MTHQDMSQSPSYYNDNQEYDKITAAVLSASFNSSSNPPQSRRSLNSSSRTHAHAHTSSRQSQAQSRLHAHPDELGSWSGSTMVSSSGSSNVKAARGKEVDLPTHLEHFLQQQQGYEHQKRQYGEGFDCHHHHDGHYQDSERRSYQQDPHQHQQRRDIAAPPAAFILGRDAEEGSVSDRPVVEWSEHREWREMKHNTHNHKSLSSTGSSNQRDRIRVSVSNASGSGYAHGDEDSDSDSDSDDEDESAHENAFLILLRISFLVPPFSLAAALYTIGVFFFLILAFPLRLFPPSAFFSSSTPFSAQISHILLPLLYIHQRLISSPPPPSRQRRKNHPYRQSSSAPSSSIASPSSPVTSTSHHHHDLESGHPPTIPNTTTAATEAASATPSPSPSSQSPPLHLHRRSAYYSTPMLLIVLLLSPILSVPFLFVAWICAFFWVFSMILGNPDGTEKRDDGRAAVLGVRNVWRMWLSKTRRKKRRKSKARTKAKADAKEKAKARKKQQPMRWN